MSGIGFISISTSLMIIIGQWIFLPIRRLTGIRLSPVALHEVNPVDQLF